MMQSGINDIVFTNACYAGQKNEHLRIMAFEGKLAQVM